MKKLKTILLCIFLIWLIPTAITALITPGFHKKSPKPRAPRVHKDREYVKIVDENEEAMVRRLQIIESAKERIVLSTYYLADDDAGRDMMAALLAASQRGVKIQILVDGFCNFTSKISRKDSFEALVSEPNV